LTIWLLGECKCAIDETDTFHNYRVAIVVDVDVAENQVFHVLAVKDSLIPLNKKEGIPSGKTFIGLALACKIFHLDR
jgi:hypothetical protein